MKAYVNAVACYLPPAIETTADLARDNPDWNAARIESKTGIHSRRIASPSELTSDLAIAAAKKLFENTSILPADIDHLIVCTQTPDHLIPSTSCRVQHGLGLSTSTAAFDINMGCSGYIYGLQVANALICSGSAHRILLINADTYSKLLSPKDLATRTLFGDGACASLVSSQAIGGEIGSIILGTDGAGYNDFVAKNSALAVDGMEDGKHLRGIRMDGPAIFNFTLERVPAMINSFLSTNNLASSDISYFVFHQANAWMLEHLRKKLGIESSQFPLILGDIGNTVSASIPMVLDSLSGRLKSGDTLVLVGFGVGLSWGVSMLTWQ